MSVPRSVLVLHDVFRKAGREVRLVGGCVRDLHLGVEPKDFDLCTDATPDEMMRLAATAGMHTIPTGLQHGTVTFMLGGQPYEITTLRVDVACDGRHAEVAFTRNWQEDAARRDLTINAMMMEIDGRVHDWFGGRADLEARRVRFVGDADARIKEDYLRILRFFRFATKFPDRGRAVHFDPSGIEAAARNADGLKRISAERIWSEVKQILAKPQGARLLPMLAETGVSAAAGLPIGDAGAAVHATMAGASPIAVLSTQIAAPGSARELAERWKMSADERDALVFIVQERGRATNERIENHLADGVRRERVVDLAKVTGLDAQHAASFPAPVFPVSGQDLLDRGMAPGPEMGRTLKVLRQAWTGSRFQLDRDRLLKALDAQAGKDMPPIGRVSASRPGSER